MEVDTLKIKKGATLNKYALIIVSQVIFVATIVVIVLMLSHRDYFTHRQTYSYLGLFINALITGSPLTIPTFCAVIVFTMGGLYNPVLVALISGLGVATGHMLVYGYSFGGYRVLTIFKIPDWVYRDYHAIVGRLAKTDKVGKVMNSVNRHATAS